MKKLQATDYIFIIGLLILLGIAGTIIFLIMSANTYESQNPTVKTSTTEEDPGKLTPPKDKEETPKWTPPNDEVTPSDEIRWAPYKSWEPAQKYEFESKFKISGVVTDSDNKPIENAEVGITPLSLLDDKVMAVEAKPYTGETQPEKEESIDVTKYDISSIAPSYKTRTNEFGQYEFPYFTGYYVLFVKKQFYYEQKLICNYDGGVKDFKLDRWGTLVGRIVNSTGGLIPDYTLSFYPAKSSKIAGDTNLICSGFETDDFRVLRYTYRVRNMRFGVYLPEGLYDVVIQAENYNEKQISAYKIEKNKQIEENFILYGNTMLKGKVTVKGKPEMPIADVAIAIQQRSNDGYSAIHNTNTDENGEYFFDITRPGKYRLTAVHGLYKSVQIELKIAENQTTTQDFQLDPGTFLSGSILTEDGEPIELAHIDLFEFPNQNLGIRPKQVKSNNEGKYVIPELMPGSYRLTVRSRQYYFKHMEIITIAEGENFKDVQLKRGVDVRIRLISDSPIPPSLHVVMRRDLVKSPLPMLKLTDEAQTEWSPAETDYAGSTNNEEEATSAFVTISGVYPGSYNISVRDDSFVEINEPISIPENVKSVDKTLNISSGFALGGIVKDNKGNIVPTAFVRILLDDTYVRTTRVDEEGKFFVQGLGNKTYTLKIEAREYKGIEKSITLTESLVNQVFVIDAGVTLTGVVMAPDGNPVREGIGVKLIAPPRGEYERYPMVRTDKDGKFEFKGLNKGKFKLEIIGAEGVQINNHEVQVPGNIIVNLSQGIKIFGTIKDNAGKPVNRATIVVRKLLENPDENDNSNSMDSDAGENVGSTFTNENGEFTIQGLESGYFDITVYNQNNRSTNPVYRKKINLTSDHEMNVLLEQTYEITGTIKFTNGNIPKNFFIKIARVDDSAIGSSGNINGKTGEFIISGLNAGAHNFELISYYSQDAVYKQTINVPVSAPLNITIEEIKMFKISGKIVDEAGEAIQYPRLQLIKIGSERFNKFGSGKSDGSFEIKDLLAGEYQILVMTPERKIINPTFKVTVVDSDITELVLKATKVIKGVYVKSVRAGSIGQTAGLQAGDIIIEYNGEEISDGNKLGRLSLMAIGQAAQVSIKILRNGTETTLMIEPGEIGLSY